MYVTVSRTSSVYTPDEQECPVEGAWKESYSGVAQNGNEYTGHEWVIEVRGLSELADMVDSSIIVSSPSWPVDKIDSDIDIEYSVEIYDDYRE